MKTNIVKISLAAAMLLSTGAYAGKIIGATAGDVPTIERQFGFGGWDSIDTGDVVVRITNLDYNDLNPIKTFYLDGTYDTMVVGDSFESAISTGGEVRGLLHGKDWPVGEPAGIKIINGDTNTHNGKPENCIMTTSYLAAEDNPLGGNGYLDAFYDQDPNTTPSPTLCSSAFQTHKRFKINLQPTTVGALDENRSGLPVDLVFNLVPDDISIQRYQVFQKINNYTGMRLDGYKIEVLDGNGDPSDFLTLSIGLGENVKGDTVTNIWDPEDLANYSHGLWGPQTFEEPEPHFPTNGFFDKTRAGFIVDPSGHETNTLVGGPDQLVSNYEALFGVWLPSKWQPIGIFHDDDNDPTTDAELVAFWGTVPNAAPGTLPGWHKGKDYDLTDGDQSWAEPTVEELITWIVDPLYNTGHIEDTLNLGLNYIVNVGNNTQIPTGKFIVRITPRAAPEPDQTPPSYIDGNGDYILPPTDYNGTDAVLVISPAPYFNLGADLSVGVADTSLNTEDNVSNETVIVITTTSGDEENLTLTETDVNSSIFVGTIGTDTNAVVVQDGTISVVDGTVVTATYGTLTDETTATDGIVTPPVTPPTTTPDPSSGGGGGCTYNPNSKSFDMALLMMLALGSLYALRRRFIK